MPTLKCPFSPESKWRRRTLRPTSIGSWFRRRDYSVGRLRMSGKQITVTYA